MLGLIWTFPVLMLASIVIGWAAELTAIHLSAGIALAVLAWLQTAPEFAVEAVIAWHQDAHLALANLTGSLRLLLGVGWPMVFFVHWVTNKSRSKVRAILLPDTFAVEAAGLLPPVLYFLYIYFKNSWSLADGVILCGFYGFYFWMLSRPKSESRKEESHAEEDEPLVVRRVLRLSKPQQYLTTLAMFAIGGLTLWFTTHVFVESLKTVAVALGISEFLFVQWVAPFASEFPEKVTAFQWARRPRKVPMAIVNMLSSVTSQWTLLAGLIPILFSLSAGRAYTIHFTAFQRGELLLTIAQTGLVVLFLSDLKITALEAGGLFLLWVIQFVYPASRSALVPVYVAWIGLEGIRIIFDPTRCVAWRKLYAIGARKRTS